MNSLSLGNLLVDSLVLCLAFGVVVLGSLRYNPRLWLQDYPPEVRAKVPPLTPQEKRDQRIVTVLFLAAVTLPLVWSFSKLEAANGGSLPFLAAYVNAFVLLQLVNLFDAVVIDWLIIAVMQPKFVELRGAEGMGHLYRDKRMHIANYLKGVVFCSAISLVVALLASL